MECTFKIQLIHYLHIHSYIDSICYTRRIMHTTSIPKRTTKNSVTSNNVVIDILKQVWLVLLFLFDFNWWCCVLWVFRRRSSWEVEKLTMSLLHNLEKNNSMQICKKTLYANDRLDWFLIFKFLSERVNAVLVVKSHIRRKTFLYHWLYIITFKTEITKY